MPAGRVEMAKIDTDLVAAVLAGMRDDQRSLDAGPIRAAGTVTWFAVVSRIADAVWGESFERSQAAQARVDRFYDLADGGTDHG